MVGWLLFVVIKLLLIKWNISNFRVAIVFQFSTTNSRNYVNTNDVSIKELPLHASKFDI